jgi:putative methionine-R-sulfoxide reductase with GAF domain
VNTTLMQEEERPWKTDLARKSAQRRELVLQDVEEAIRKASSFEEALRQGLEILKKRFARYSAITAYVADGEDLVVQTSLDRPAGPDRVGTSGGPLADAGHGHATTVVSDVSQNPGWAAVGLTSGSAMISPVRTEAGLWAIVEVWSDFRDAFTAHDSKMLAKVTLALAKKTPTA